MGVEEGNHAKDQQVDQEISHDLLLEQSTQGDIAAATQQHQEKDHLAESQQDDSTKADEPDLLDHGLNLVVHSAPLNRHYDTEAGEPFEMIWLLRAKAMKGRTFSGPPQVDPLGALRSWGWTWWMS